VAVMIGAGPHKASHTAVVISAAEEPLGEVRVRAEVVAGPGTGTPSPTRLCEQSTERNQRAIIGLSAWGEEFLEQSPTGA
jgi:hypothetical protein